MARLTFETPDGKHAEHALSPSAGEVRIGRHPGCEVVVPSPSVSRHHARIVPSGDGFVLEDLGSSNGVFVGGQRIKKHKLGKKQLEFQLGDIHFVYDTAEVDEEPDVGDVEETSPGLEAAAAPAKGTRKAAPAADEKGDGTSPALKKRLAERDDELATTQTRIGELKANLRQQELVAAEAQRRAAALATELARLAAELDEARSQAADYEAAAEEAVGRAEAAERRVVETRQAQAEAKDELANMKSRVARQERRIGELEGVQEASASELETLRADLATWESRLGASHERQEELERKLNELREVIGEKERIVAELQSELATSEAELARARLSGGGQLQPEHRRLVANLEAATREIATLRERLVAVEADGAARTEELAAAERRARELEKRFAEREDVKAHPEFVRVNRELRRSQKALQGAERELAGLRERLTEATAEDADALREAQAELVAERDGLKERLDAAEQGLAALRRVGQGGVDPELAGQLTEAAEALDANLTSLRSHLKDVQKGLEILETLDAGSLKDPDKRKLKRAKPGSALGSVVDALDAAEGDIARLLELTAPSGKSD